MTERFKIFLTFFACLAAFAVIRPVTAAASGASSAIVAELTTQTVLKEQNADIRLPMASTTKIMTALLICEDCNPDEEVVVPEEAVGIEGSSIALKADERIDVRDLAYGLMLRSGNDAATALAIIHSGSVEKFVAEMNERAKRIGAEHTNFTNPSGLPDDNHYTTARDLCRIACAAMGNENFRKIVSTKKWNGRFRSFTNKNKMLYNYDGATGIKTGYTLKAGRCLVCSALRDGMELVCVVLNHHEMYNDSARLLDECFSTYSLERLRADRVFMCNGRPCTTRKDCNLVIKKGEHIDYVCENRDGKDGVWGVLKIFREKRLIFEGNLYSIV